MIAEAIILSMQITAVYVLFQEGMLLGWLRIGSANCFDRVLGKRISRYIQKPLWDCLPCMSGLWTIVILRELNFPLIFAVCGINALIEKILDHEGIIDG